MSVDAATPDDAYAFDADTAVVPIGPGRYAGEITPRWHIGVVPNGGYVLAVALSAVHAAVGAGDPLTVTGHYLGPCAAGPVEIEVDVLKRSRSLTTASARLSQDGRDRLAVLASYGDLGAQQGPTLLSAAPPDLPPPDECTRRMGSPSAAFPVPVAISQVVEFLMSPATAAALNDVRERPAEIEGWLRFVDGRDADVHALPLLCDAMPPALFVAMSTGWVPTLELTVHVRGRPEPGWLAARVRTRVLVDGLCEEDCELWDGAGRLVAMSRQLARVLSAPG